MLNNSFNIIKKNIQGGKINSPCLFLGNNLEIINSDIKNNSIELLNEFGIPKSYLYTLEDKGEKIKIKELKEFLNYSKTKPGYPFQIFFIENIYRLTLTSSNSLLKFFEEPGKHNIILLSSSGENGILDTILSRTKIINLGGVKTDKKNIFLYNLIENYIKNGGNEIFGYFFKNKLEKEEYISFLDNLIIYNKDLLKNGGNIFNGEQLSEIDNDINAIKQNNVNAKYVVDKWLLKL